MSYAPTVALLRLSVHGRIFEKAFSPLFHPQHLTTQGDSRMEPVDKGMCVL